MSDEERVTRKGKFRKGEAMVRWVSRGVSGVFARPNRRWIDGEDGKLDSGWAVAWRDDLMRKGLRTSHPQMGPVI